MAEFNATEDGLFAANYTITGQIMPDIKDSDTLWLRMSIVLIMFLQKLFPDHNKSL